MVPNRGVLSFLDQLKMPPMDGAPEDDPLNQPVPNAVMPPSPRGMTEETPAGVVNPQTGAEMLPNTETLPDQEGPDPSIDWNQEVQRLPVYEYQGQRIVGDLRWAPEWPQNLQPVDWVIVPSNGSEWKQS